jgi:1-acyl-sn-glycerol-3-phosphate acyltransferase
MQHQSSSTVTPAPKADLASGLLVVIGAFVAELHPQRRPPVTLDSRLEQDLGLDSLSRAELLLRIERASGVAVPEQALASAETPRDLLLLLQHAAPALAPAQGLHPLAAAASAGLPAGAQTLIDVLDWHVRAHPDQRHIHLYGAEEGVEDISYGALERGAHRIAAGLTAFGLQPGETVATMLPTGQDYLFSFFGILIAGGVPVPLYPPARLSQVEDHVRRHTGILANSQARLLITVPEAKPLSLLLRAKVESLRDVITAEDLAARAGPLQRVARTPSDLALLQYTSGSTGNPKGVALTHANLLANIRAFGPALEVGAGDVFVSWLPLYHDMGLIGAWLGTLYYGVPLVLMSPLAFLARPTRWLRAIHRHGGTLTAAPNFAYELCARKLPEQTLEGLDLSSMRVAMNGSEPVSMDTLDAFACRFAAYGLRREALMPVYGLAECSVALAFPAPGRAPHADVIERETLMREGRAVPAKSESVPALQVVSCGRPLPGHQIRIVDSTGREVPDRVQGRLEFQGPSTTAGYFRNPEQTRKLFHDGWLDSGDYAYIADGEVHITGRVKDLIIRGGRNIHPQDLELAIGNAPGIRKGCVAVFASPDPTSGTERLVVLAETRETDPAARERLTREIQAVAVDLVGLPADDVVLAPPHTVLKTSSGKIRRAASREYYERRGLRTRPAPVALQFARLLLSAAVPELRRGSHAFAALLYAGYAWTVLFLVAIPTWALVSIARRPRVGRTVCHRAARLLAALAGIRVHATGLENLPDRPHLLASNHASYIDAIVLGAVLPPRHAYVFVAKREFAQSWISKLFLRGLDAVLVERIDPRQGVEDVGRVEQAARGGASPVFFPEGTFDRRPGLREFHLGTFLVAARTGLPVVPAGLRGTRSILRGESWFPRSGGVSVSFGAPELPSGSDWAATLDLRDRVKAEIMRLSGEPERLE